MNNLYGKLKKDLGLTLILAIGLSVEFSNFQSMFYRFMLQYRHDWGAFNHLPAIFLSGFLLLCIVIFGIRKQTALSWFLALLTCVISFAVYSRMGLRWNWASLSEVHFVVVILSGMLPMLVAYTTHQISQEVDPQDVGNQEKREMDNMMDQIRKMYGSANTSFNGQKYEDEKKKGRTIIVEEVEERVAQKIRRKRNTPKPETQIIYALPAYVEPEMVWEQPEKEQVTETLYSFEPIPLAVPLLAQTATPQPKAEVKLEPVRRETHQTEQHTEPEPATLNETAITIEIRQLEKHTCEHCGKEMTRTNKNTRYCSNICRMTAIRSKKKSDFYALHDQFDQAGFMEWVNPDFA